MIHFGVILRYGLISTFACGYPVVPVPFVGKLTISTVELSEHLC